MLSSVSGTNRSFAIRAIAVFFAAFLFFFCGTGDSSLWDIDEPIYAQSLKEQIAEHNLVVPLYNGHLLPDKPELNYWLMWVGVRLLGMNAWGLRIGSAMVGALLSLYIILALRRICGEGVSLLSGLLVATALHSTVIFRSATPDPLLVLTVTVSLLSYLRGYLYPEIRSRELHVSYVAMALATLDKGPIGFLLPGLIIVLFLMLRKQIHFLWKNGYLITGVLLFVLICFPWYMAVGLETGWNWDRLFIIQQNIGRFDNSMQGHKGPWMYYLVSTFLGMLPWSIFLPEMFYVIWDSRKNLFSGNPERLFFLVWAAAWIAFFSLSATKLPNYVLEAYPPLFFLLAIYFEEYGYNDVTEKRRLLYFSIFFLFVIGAALSIFGTFFLPFKEFHLPKMPELGIPYMAAAAISVLAIHGGRWKESLTALGVGSILLSMMLVFVIIPPINKLKPSRRMGIEIARVQGGSPYRLASWKWFQPSFLFYAGRGNMPIHRLKNASQISGLTGTEPLFLVCPKKNTSSVYAAVSPGTQVRTIMTSYELYSHEYISLIEIK